VAGFIGSPAMNFVTADLVRDDGAAVTFAGYKLPVPAEVLDAKTGLANYFGKNVILGVRPSDFEDASLGKAGRGTMRVTAGVVEELGSEIMMIFTIDAPHVEHASLAQAAEASADEDEATAALVGGKSLWTARVSKESRVKHGGRSSWPSTRATCSSSTRPAACPSATRKPRRRWRTDPPGRRAPAWAAASWAPSRRPGRSITRTVGNCRDAAESGGTLRARSGRA
jgi:hypothetical protein